MVAIRNDRSRALAYGLQRLARMTQHSKADGNHGRSARKGRGPKTGTLPQSPGARRDAAEVATGGRHTESTRRKVNPKPSRAKARATSRRADA